MTPHVACDTGGVESVREGTIMILTELASINDGARVWLTPRHTARCRRVELQAKTRNHDNMVDGDDGLKSSTTQV